MAEQTFTRTRALKQPLLWAFGVLLLSGVPVQITGTGIDVFAVLAAGTVLFALERTLGDAVAEVVGPVGAALLFCAVGGLGFGYVLTNSGQQRVKRFLAATEARGYEPLLFTAERVNDKDKPYKVKPPTASGAERSAQMMRSAPIPEHRGDGTASGSALPPSAEGVPVGSGFFPFWREKEIPLSRLTVAPDIVLAGDTVSLEVRFMGGEVMLRGPLVFFVNGEEVARAGPDENGVASASTKARYPGQYTVAVRLPAGTRAKPAASVSFTVLPSRR